MKVLERVLESLICSLADINNMQEKHLIRKANIYFAFVNLEKAFDRVPRSVLWGAIRKLGIDEWIVRLVKAMYDGETSRVRINGCFCERFEINVGVHKGCYHERP